jgi:hypothetical protein
MNAFPGENKGAAPSLDLPYRFYRELFPPRQDASDLLTDLEDGCPGFPSCGFLEESGAVIPFESPNVRRLFVSTKGDVTAAAFKICAANGGPIREFSRVWLICGSHVLFVVDRIRAERPVKVIWNWLLQDQEPSLALKLVPPDRLVARRGQAGMKLFHLGAGMLQDSILVPAIDTRPPACGTLARWIEAGVARERTVVHAMTLDDRGEVAGWHLRREEGFAAVIEAPCHIRKWKLALAEGEVSVTHAPDNSRSAWSTS